MQVRHSSTENTHRGRPKPISRTRSSPLVSLTSAASISPTAAGTKTGVVSSPDDSISISTLSTHYKHTIYTISTPNNYTEYLHYLLTIY